MVVCQIPYGVQTHRRISRPERDFHNLSACFIAMAATRKVVDIGQKRETVVCGFGIQENSLQAVGHNRRSGRCIGRGLNSGISGCQQRHGGSQGAY